MEEKKTKKTERRPLTVSEVAIELAGICEAHAYTPPKSLLCLVTDFAAKHGAVTAARFLTMIRWHAQNRRPLAPEFELLEKNTIAARTVCECYMPAMKEVAS